MISQRWPRVGPLAASILLGGFALLWVGAIFVIRPWDAPARREAQATAVAQGRTLLLEELALPAGATPYDPAEQLEPTPARRGRFDFVLAREYQAPGFFADTVSWYQAQLEARGWQPFDPAGWRDFHADFCKTPWLLELDRTASYEEGRSPEHRFLLRLTWLQDVSPDRCPYPGD